MVEASNEQRRCKCARIRLGASAVICHPFLLYLLSSRSGCVAPARRREGSNRSVTEASQSYFEDAEEMRCCRACSPGLRSPRRLGLGRTRDRF